MEVKKSNRPHLRHISPLIYFVSWAYGITNLFIGSGIFHTPFMVLAKAYPFVKEPFGPHFFGGVFFLMGVVGIISLLTKHWDWTRRVMMFGLGIKSLFFYGLVSNLRVHFWDFIAITAVWALIAVTQFLTVVYFPKEHKNGIS